MLAARIAALRAARKTSQQTAHHCTNAYWLNLCNSIQRAADFRDARGMYMGVKKTTGPTPTKSAPLMSKSGYTITEQGRQLECWVKHYFKLYSAWNVVTQTALDPIPVLDRHPPQKSLTKPSTTSPAARRVAAMAFLQKF